MEAIINTMSKLDTQAIIDLMAKFWNKPEGGIFREAGFDIIEDRLGEEESDRIYNNLYDELSR